MSPQQTPQSVILSSQAHIDYDSQAGFTVSTIPSSSEPVSVPLASISPASQAQHLVDETELSDIDQCPVSSQHGSTHGSTVPSSLPTSLSETSQTSRSQRSQQQQRSQSQLAASQRGSSQDTAHSQQQTAMPGLSQQGQLDAKLQTHLADGSQSSSQPASQPAVTAHVPSQTSSHPALAVDVPSLSSQPAQQKPSSQGQQPGIAQPQPALHAPGSESSPVNQATRVSCRESHESRTFCAFLLLFCRLICDSLFDQDIAIFSMTTTICGYLRMLQYFLCSFYFTDRVQSMQYLSISTSTK